MVIWLALLGGLVFFRQNWAKAIVAALIVGYIILVFVSINEVPKFAQSKLALIEAKNALIAIVIITVVYFASRKYRVSQKLSNKTATAEIVHAEVVPQGFEQKQEKKIFFDKHAKYGSFVGMFLLLNMIFFGIVGLIVLITIFREVLGGYLKDEGVLVGFVSFAICALICYLIFGYLFENKNYTTVLLVIFAVLTIAMILAVFAMPLFFILAVPYGFSTWYLYNHLSK